MGGTTQYLALSSVTWNLSACCMFSIFLHRFPTGSLADIHDQLTGDFKLALGVNVSMNGWSESG